jgi:hypothetical protein
MNHLYDRFLLLHARWILRGEDGNAGTITIFGVTIGGGLAAVWAAATHRI